MTDRSTARTVVHLLRHGLVDNPDGILYGRLPDFHLSATGRAMADRVAEHLAAGTNGGSGNIGAPGGNGGNADRDICYLAASPLDRAAETAEPLARALGLAAVTDERLIEPTNVFEGTAFAVGDGVLKRPGNWRYVRDPFTPSWGEAYISIARRMLGAVYGAVHVASGREAVLVSHQLPIWTVRRYLEGKRLWHNPAHRQCGLASLTSLTFTDGVLTAMAYREPAADLVPAFGAGATGA